jgi:hypothetical protein
MMEVEFKRDSWGVHWTYKCEKHNLSIILNNGSYGGDKGLFETLCSWLPDVQGYLSFGQVQTKINHIYKLEKRDKLQGANKA